MSVVYKFASSKDIHEINIGGPSIKVVKLKELIMEANDMQSLDSDLKIIDQNTNKRYMNDEHVMANTVLQIKRSYAGKKKGARVEQFVKPTQDRYRRERKLTHVQLDRSGMNNYESKQHISSLHHRRQVQMDEMEFPEKMVLPGLSKNRGMEKSAESKDDNKDSNLEKFLSATDYEYNPTGLQVKRKPNAPPEKYVCDLCGSKEHYKQDCPKRRDPNFNEANIIRSQELIGIPKTHFESIDEDEASGKIFRTGGTFARIRANDKAFNRRLEKFKKKNAVDSAEAVTCPLCNNIFNDAVLVPCCTTTYCASCITNELTEKTNFACPNCSKKVKISLLIPNKSKRKAAEAYRAKMQVADTKMANNDETQTEEKEEPAIYLAQPTLKQDESIEASLDKRMEDDKPQHNQNRRNHTSKQHRKSNRNRGERSSQSRRRNHSPPSRNRSPVRRSHSPTRRGHSPNRRNHSPNRRNQSPIRRSHSNHSPIRRNRSPPRRSRSPPRRNRSPPRRNRSPPRRMSSPPPHRDDSESDGNSERRVFIADKQSDLHGKRSRDRRSHSRNSRPRKRRRH